MEYIQMTRLVVRAGEKEVLAHYIINYLRHVAFPGLSVRPTGPAGALGHRHPALQSHQSREVDETRASTKLTTRHLSTVSDGVDLFDSLIVHLHITRTKPIMSRQNWQEEAMRRVRQMQQARGGGMGGAPQMPKGGPALLAGGLLLMGGAYVLSNSLFNVDGGQRAIKYRRLNGVSKEIYNEGTHAEKQQIMLHQNIERTFGGSFRARGGAMEI
jgi:prohibitin 2